MNKTKVLVFTNVKRWDSFSRVLRLTLVGVDPNWKSNYPGENNVEISKFEFINNKAQLTAVDFVNNPITDEEGIFLVYDQLNQSKFNMLKTQCNNVNLFVMAHTNGSYPQSAFTNWNCQSVKEGSHVLDDAHYPYIYRILTDANGDKMNRIIKKVFKPSLEIVLRYLHNCLTPPSDVTVMTNQYTIILNNLPINSNVRATMQNCVPSQQLSYAQISTLRDQLLDYALAQN